MSDLHYREAQPSDIAGMAKIRSGDWGTEDYWTERIARYLGHELARREALSTRVAFVCAEGDRVVGLIAGHQHRTGPCAHVSVSAEATPVRCVMNS